MTFLDPPLVPDEQTTYRCLSAVKNSKPCSGLDNARYYLPISDNPVFPFLESNSNHRYKKCFGSLNTNLSHPDRYYPLAGIPFAHLRYRSLLIHYFRTILRILEVLERKTRLSRRALLHLQNTKYATSSSLPRHAHARRHIGYSHPYIHFRSVYRAEECEKDSLTVCSARKSRQW